MLGPASACSAVPRSCLASDSSTATTKSVRYTNFGAANQQVFVIVDAAATGTASGGLTLTVGFATPPPPLDGEFCANATSVTLSTTATIFTHSLTGCRAYSGPERAYAVTIPAGKTLTATVTPSNFDAVLNFIPSPATQCQSSGSVCVASRDTGGTAEPETMTYANTDTNAVSGFVLASGYASTSSGSYVLHLTHSP